MNRFLFCFLLFVFVTPGCNNDDWQLKEIRSKQKVGPEFRHSGTKNTDKVRWSVQQSIEFSFANGVKTAVAYRRRDDDRGGGNNDNGVWFELSVPLYKAKDNKYIKLQNRVRRLENKIININNTKEN